MRTLAPFCDCPPLRRTSFPLLVLLMTALAAMLPTPASARDKAEAEAAARKVATQLEREEKFEFRADAWLKDLDPKVGKAVRVQLFKGNDYRFVIAVPPDSGVHVSAMVLDFDGDPVGKFQPVLAGWGCVLHFKPEKTGIYVVSIRQTDEGKQREVPCAMITGWK